MPSFFDRISNKFQAPAEKGKSAGGGSLPPSLEVGEGKYDNLQPNQTFISADGKRKIRITCIDPTSAYEYSREETAGIHLYNEDPVKALAELQQELKSGGFRPESSNGKKKPKSKPSSADGTNTEVEPSGEADAHEGVEAQVAAPEAAVSDPTLPDKDAVGVAPSVVTPETVSSSPEATAVEGVSDILEQLAPEGAELRKMMNGHMEMIKLRGSSGWINSFEEGKLRRMWKESDEILKKTFASFQEKGTDIEKARKELESVRVNLSIVYTNEDDKAGFNFFKKTGTEEEKHGAEEVEMIKKMFRDARETYFQSFPKGKIPKEANKYWKKYTLQELEEEILAYMNAVTQEGNEKKKTRMNRGAIQMILTNIAIDDSKSE